MDFKEGQREVLGLPDYYLEYKKGYLTKDLYLGQIICLGFVPYTVVRHRQQKTLLCQGQDSMMGDCHNLVEIV